MISPELKPENEVPAAALQTLNQEMKPLCSDVNRESNRLVKAVKKVVVHNCLFCTPVYYFCYLPLNWILNHLLQELK